MLKNTICIEFIGIWGSGKSALINELSKKLQSEGIVVARFLDFDKQTMLKRYFSIGLFFLRHPLYIFKSLFFFVKILYILRPNDYYQILLFKNLINRLTVTCLLVCVIIFLMSCLQIRVNDVSLFFI